MTIFDSSSAGLKSILQQRSQYDAGQGGGEALDTTNLGLLSTRSYYKQAAPSEPLSYADRIQLPPSQGQTVAFNPSDRITRVTKPPSDKTQSVQQKLEPVRTSDASATTGEQANRARLRAARTDEVSDFVKQPEYLAFFDPSKVRLDHSVNADGTKITQTTDDFRTRTLESQTTGDKIETVRCPAGKPLFTKVTGRSGEWEINEMSYAVNPATGRESFALSQKRTANSQGEDRLTTYDKGLVVAQSTQPLELKKPLA
ncbi:MAG TPA: hypothetical protein V6C81_22100 [Planktothrix sp.]|jgi:hypothetical protein